MVFLPRLGVVICFVALLSGCADPDGAPPVASVGSAFSVSYHIVGPLPIFSSQLPLFLPVDGDVILTLVDGGQRYDAGLRPHETLELKIVDATSSGEIGRVYLDAMDLSVVQVLQVVKQLPERFGEQVILRNATEPACLFGSAFYGSSKGSSVLVPMPGGEHLEFSPVGDDRIFDRTVIVYETTASRGESYRLWIDPSIPCPLKGERTGGRAAEFSFAALAPPVGQVEIREGRPLKTPVAMLDRAPFRSAAPLTTPCWPTWDSRIGSPQIRMPSLQRPSSTAIADAGAVATIGSYYNAQHALFPAISPQSLRISLIDPAPIVVMDYVRGSTGACDLTTCMNDQTLGSLTFDPITGGLIGFSGGFDAWNAAQPVS